MTQRPSARGKAIELGATINSGINWDWANGFPSKEVGEAFVKWLDAHGYEHRGVYPDGEPLKTVSVRFR